jgi:hypothetical protein
MPCHAMSVRAADAVAAAAAAAAAASAVIGERSLFLSSFVGAINVDERGAAACLLACLPACLPACPWTCVGWDTPRGCCVMGG